eukprot:scaffold12.g8000.t1
MAHALLLAGECAAVSSSLRSNVKWQPSKYNSEAEELEDPLLEEFKTLRRRLFTWTDWSAVEPLEYLSPFLEVVRSPETSGPITLTALTSLLKLIRRDVLGASASGVAEAVQATSDAVTQCKFEATYPASDECVLYKILEVLGALVRCPWGKLLTSDNLLNIFQATDRIVLHPQHGCMACYRIGHYTSDKGRDTSELLTQASRQAMADMVQEIFAGLEAIPEPDMSPYASLLHGTPRLQVSPGPSTLTSATAEPAGSGEFAEGRPSTAEGEEEEAAGGNGGEAAPPPQAACEGEPPAAAADTAAEAGAEPSAVFGSVGQRPGEGPEAAGAEPPQEGQGEQAPPASGEEQPASPFKAAGKTGGTPGAEAPVDAGPAPAPHAGEIVSLLPPVEAHSTEVEGYGIDAVKEVLLFIISLVGTPPLGVHQDLPAHGLDLMNAALQAAGPALGYHETLLALLRQDLVPAMFAAARQPRLSTLAGVCQVTLALYTHLGSYLLLQARGGWAACARGALGMGGRLEKSWLEVHKVEALLALLLLPLAEGHGAAGVEQQQAAVEGILDFCYQPGFVRKAYLNLDCRIERSNLFEQICGLLSKAAFPVSGPVGAVHLLSVDGIQAILSSLSTTATGASEADPGHLAPLSDPPAFVDIWTPLCAGRHPPVLRAVGGALRDGREGGVAEVARAEKYLKGRLATAAEHFNRDQKKGFAYLQSMKLLPGPKLDAVAVAHFLRACPGLAKPAIGEILGEKGPFYDAVREAFLKTFEFEGMDFDMALRLFMDAFRPPGEGQKIDRIMQARAAREGGSTGRGNQSAFGTRYHAQMPSMGLKSADAAYVLAFSNKKKMSLADFSRINRNTNDGDPMPPELLREIYASIARDELKISSEASADELPAVFWTKLALEARLPRSRSLASAAAFAAAAPAGLGPGAGLPPERLPGCKALEREMFELAWGPTLAAVSVLLDNASDPGAVEEVVDSIIVLLSKFLAVLHPAAPRAVVALGESAKARAAIEAMYGDLVRGGWRNVLECVMRLHRLELLPPGVIAADAEDPQQARARLPRPASLKAKPGASLFSRAINSLISIDSADPAGAEGAKEAAAQAAALACVEACRVDEVFADSKFLTGESLVELVKATMWAAGNVVGAAASGERTDQAELALELLVTIALRNRDRGGLIWPLLHEFLAACTAPETAQARARAWQGGEANPLVERAVMGLLRVCQRLLPYKEDTAEMLLSSMKLVVGLSPEVFRELAVPIAGEMLVLLKHTSPYIRTEADWRTVCAIIAPASLRSHQAAALGFECLSEVCNEPRALSAESYMPLLECCLQYTDAYKHHNPAAAVQFLGLIDTVFSWLLSAAQAQQPPAGDARQQQRERRQQQREPAAEAEEAEESPLGTPARPPRPPALSDEAMVDLWLSTMQVLSRNLCMDECQPLRDSAIMVLWRGVAASEPLDLPPELWVQAVRELLVPVVRGLVQLANSRGRGAAGAGKSVRLAVSMLTKAAQLYLPLMAGDREVYPLWQATLQALQDCMAVRQEEVAESVPENVKSMLLVLYDGGLLRPGWQDAEGRSLWDLTWSRVSQISSALNPEMVGRALAPPPAPPAPPPASPAPAAAPAAAAEPTAAAGVAGAAEAAAAEATGAGGGDAAGAAEEAVSTPRAAASAVASHPIEHTPASSTTTSPERHPPSAAAAARDEGSARSSFDLAAEAVAPPAEAGPAAAAEAVAPPTEAGPAAAAEASGDGGAAAADAGGGEVEQGANEYAEEAQAEQSSGTCKQS